MDIKLEKGQKIYLVIYNGESQVEAEATAGWLEELHKGKSPTLINNLGLSLLVENVKLTKKHDPAKLFGEIYTVEVRGELV